MKKVILPAVLLFLLAVFNVEAQDKIYPVKSFEELIISPHIEINLVEGVEESVRIENAKVSEDKIKIEVVGKTLRIYLEGAKMATTSEKVDQDKLKLAIYGQSKVYFNAVTTKELIVSIYGESYLEIKSGSVDHQLYRAYGESKVNTAEMDNKFTKITAYGESNFRVKVSDHLKVTCYGESTINYTGEEAVDKGIVYGEAEIRRIG